MSDLRVHIVPVGYDTYTRVTVPLEQMDANKIYFIKHEKGAIRGHEKFFSKIKNIVKQSNRKFEEKYTDIWDLYKCLELYRVIISKEIKKRNHVFINVSTGTKVTAMAGILACMIFNQTPYYVRLKNPTKKKMTRIPYVAVADPQNMPTFEIKKPSDVVLKILNQISKSKYKMLRKWQLIEYLEKEGKIRQLISNVGMF